MPLDKTMHIRGSVTDVPPDYPGEGEDSPVWGPMHISGTTASPAVESGFTASRVLVTDSVGRMEVSDVTADELAYLDGVSAVQRTATLTVAASDASAASIAAADYQCDGTADDDDISTAMALMTSGGLLSASQGTFDITAALDPLADTILAGQGLNATKLVLSSASPGGTGLLQLPYTKHYIHVRDLGIDCGSLGTVYGVYVQGEYGVLENLKIDNSTRTGIATHASRGDHLTIVKCFLGPTVKTGASLQVPYSTIALSRLLGATDYGLSFDSYGAICLANEVASVTGGNGIALQSSANAMVVLANVTHGITGAGLLGLYPHNSVFMGNVADSCTKNLLDTGRGNYCAILGNTGRDSPYVSEVIAGVCIEGAWGTVIGNTSELVGGPGIACNKGTGDSKGPNAFIGNVARRMRTAGIVVYNDAADLANDSIVANNICCENGQKAVGDSSGIGIQMYSSYCIVTGNQCGDRQDEITRTLSSDAASGQKDVVVSAVGDLFEGQWVTISDDTPQSENNQIDSISGTTLTMTTNLSNTYTTGQNAVVTGRNTQTYGIKEGGSADYNIYKGNHCFGNVTCGLYTIGAHNTYDFVVQSPELDLSAAGDDVDLTNLFPDKTMKVAKVDVIYTEGSSADAGNEIRIGKTGDTDYFFAATSEVSKAQWYSKTYVMSDTELKHLVHISAGDHITVGHTQKTGAGKVILQIHIAENCE